ncbi:hypothetical protein YC2023_008171 [Brassica napus]
MAVFFIFNIQLGQTGNQVRRIVLKNLGIQAAVVSYSVLNPIRYKLFSFIGFKRC